jgi:hypothetical protein
LTIPRASIENPGVSTSTRGACLCGAVTFAIAPPYRWFAHCHCSMCRKHHGTLFGTGLGVADERLEWLGGSADIVHYRASAAFERPFCRHCGSTVPARSQDARYWHVPAGLLEGDPGARPRSQIFAASRSPLFELDDGLPQHEAYPPGTSAPHIEPRPATEPVDGIAGSCLCGGVAFAVGAMPPRVINCYCSLCRRRSAGAFTSTLLAPAAQFRWLRGATRVRTYALPAPRRYGADFCADCGSPVPSLATGQTSTMLPAGAIDSALPALPGVHLYVGSKAPWYTITDTWPQFDELPPREWLTEFFQ